MKTLSLLIIFLINTTCIAPKTVYLCDSPGGKKYHYSNKCRGLSNCQRKVIPVTIETAKKKGKTLCKWED